METLALQVLGKIFPCLNLSRRHKHRTRELDPLLPKSTTPPEPQQPRILRIKLHEPNPKTTATALTLNPTLIALLEVSLLMRRDLTAYEKTTKAQRDMIKARETDTRKQVQALNAKLRSMPSKGPSQNKRDTYSIQCAVQALEEVRADCTQRMRDMESDLASRREGYCAHQTEIDEILDDAFLKAGMIPAHDETARGRPTLDNLDVSFLEVPSGQTPLQALIAERLRLFCVAEERVNGQAKCLEACWKMWREEHGRGDDGRSQGTFLREHKEYECFLGHEYQVAEEGYKCLLNAEKLMGREAKAETVPKTVVTAPVRPQRRRAANVKRQSEGGATSGGR